MSYWRDNEIQELLPVRANAKIITKIQETERGLVIYDVSKTAISAAHILLSALHPAYSTQMPPLI